MLKHLLLGLEVVLEDANSELLSLSGRDDALCELGVKRGVENGVVILFSLVGDLPKNELYTLKKNHAKKKPFRRRGQTRTDGSLQSS